MTYIQEPDHAQLESIANQVGLQKLEAAFRTNTFVYGTMGKGSLIVSGIKRWLSRPRRSDWEVMLGEGASAACRSPTEEAKFQARRAERPQPVQVPHRARPDGVRGRDMGATSGRANHRENTPNEFRELLNREVNLFDPGRRANYWIDSGCQMMDLYYGETGTNVHEKRIPAIAEFVHCAMQFSVPFEMKKSGRETYMEHFNTSIEGYDPNTPSAKQYRGLTATKEMSRIIRWGISRFGGTLIFEGRELYYSQVFANMERCGDTDLEARELFKYFTPGRSTVAFGKGKIIFYWSGKETVPTKVHFLTNWTWHNNETHGANNIAAATFLRENKLLPIWNNFDIAPKKLSHFDQETIWSHLRQLSGSI